MLTFLTRLHWNLNPFSKEIAWPRNTEVTPPILLPATSDEKRSNLAREKNDSLPRLQGTSEQEVPDHDLHRGSFTVEY